MQSHPDTIYSICRVLGNPQAKKYGFTHIPHVSYKCRSCSPHQVALHHQLSDYQTWIPAFKRTQSGYKPVYSPDFTYLAQKFMSALTRCPISWLPLAASLFSSKTSNMDFYSLKTWYHQHSTSFSKLHSLHGSNVQLTKRSPVVDSWFLTLSLIFIDSKLPCLQYKLIPSFRSSIGAF